MSISNNLNQTLTTIMLYRDYYYSLHYLLSVLL